MHTTETDTIHEIAQKKGLSEEDFERIKQLLGRIPNLLELHVFSVAWSENVSLRSSVKWLRTLPMARERSEGAPGGGNQKVEALAIESRTDFFSQENYSDSPVLDFVTHFDGSGNRSIASLLSFHFSSLSKSKAEYFSEKSLSSVPFPTILADLFYHENEGQKELASQLMLGTQNAETKVPDCADGPGNPVFILTDADEIEEEWTLDDLTNPSLNGQAEKVPPKFSQIEGLVGVKKIGRGGLAVAAARMCLPKKVGMTIFVDKILPEEQGGAEEVLTKKMWQLLVVANRENIEALTDFFSEKNIQLQKIGEVTESGRLEFFSQNKKVADLPADALVNQVEMPSNDLPTARPLYFKKTRQFQTKKIKSPQNHKLVAKKLFGSKKLALRHWVFGQSKKGGGDFDMSGDAVLVPPENAEKATLVAMVSPAHHVFSDPYLGASIAVALAAKKITCAGGQPCSLTHHFHFGDPKDPAVYFQFTNAIKGMGDACRKFSIGAGNGQVSFHLPSTGGAANPFFPAPILGMVGILEKAEHHTPFAFQKTNDLIYMIGNSYNDMGSSEYLRTVHGVGFSPAPKFDLHEEYEIQEHIRNLIRSKVVASAHGVSDGGLFTCLMDSAIVGRLGFRVETVETFRKDCFLFGESQGRVVISLSPNNEDELQNYLIGNNVSFTKLGEVIGNDAVINEENFGSIKSWKTILDNTFNEILDD